MLHGLSCSAARGIFPDQELNPCPLHGQADSYPLRRQGSPYALFLKEVQKRQEKEGVSCFLSDKYQKSMHAIIPAWIENSDEDHQLFSFHLHSSSYRQL